MIIEVYADVSMECRGIYMFKTRGLGACLPQGEFEFFVYNSVAFKAILDHSMLILTLK